MIANCGAMTPLQEWAFKTSRYSSVGKVQLNTDWLDMTLPSSAASFFAVAASVGVTARASLKMATLSSRLAWPQRFDESHRHVRSVPGTVYESYCFSGTTSGINGDFE